MSKHFFILLLFLLVSLPVLGAETVEEHNNYFLLGGRKVVVVTSKNDMQYNEEISAFLSSHGAQVMSGLMAQLFYSHVSLQPGMVGTRGTEGFSIKVNKNKITIHYSSAPYAARAVAYLKTLFAEPYAQRMIRGVNVTVIENQAKGSAQPRINGSIVDCTSRYLSTATIQAAIRRVAALGIPARADNYRVIVQMASPSAFRMTLDCFNLFNPLKAIIPRNEAYSAATFGELTKYANMNNIQILLGVDLLSRNEIFERWSGHTLNSVEGMRLVRALLEELSQKWGVKSLCIGTSDAPYASDARYRDFLNQIATATKLELVIL